MSEPLGCSGQLTSTYGPDSTLETVPEDARRQTGKTHAAKSYPDNLKSDSLDIQNNIKVL